MSCSSCHHILLPGLAKQLLIAQCTFLDAGMVSDALSLEDLVLDLKSDEGSQKVIEVLVKEKLALQVGKIRQRLNDERREHDTSMLEALRSQFLNEAIRQQVRQKYSMFFIL